MLCFSGREGWLENSKKKERKKERKVAKLAARQMFLAAAKNFAAAESLRREGVARVLGVR